MPEKALEKSGRGGEEWGEAQWRIGEREVRKGIFIVVPGS